jgi:hypothetical protein
MKISVPKSAFVVAASVIALTGMSMAAAQQSGLVNVDVSNVANNIAKNINVDVSQIPVTVQAPIGIAANVCGVNANVLAKQGTGAASCTATSTSTALDQIVLRQLKSGKQK